MKRENLYITAALCLFAGFIVFIIGFAMMGFNFKNFDTEPAFIEKSFECDSSINKIVIEDKESDMNFTRSADDKIHITYYENSKHTYSFDTTASGILTVTSLTRRGFTEIFDISMSTLLLDVQIPENYNGNIYVKDANGDISVKDCSLAGFHAESDAGFIHITGTTVGSSLDLDTDSGEIGVYDVSVGSTAKLSSDSGRIYAQKISVSDLYAEGDSGLVTVSDIVADSSITLQSDNANIEFASLSFGNGVTVISDSGDISGTLIGNENDYLYNCKTDSGNCLIPDAESNPNGKRLNVRSKSGNISISVSDNALAENVE